MSTNHFYSLLSCVLLTGSMARIGKQVEKIIDDNRSLREEFNITKQLMKAFVANYRRKNAVAPGPAPDMVTTPKGTTDHYRTRHGNTTGHYKDTTAFNNTNIVANGSSISCL